MMRRNWWYRFIFLILFTVISVVAVVPTLMNHDPETSQYPIKSKISLGLDLQGGLYMILGIDFNKVYKEEVTNYLKRAESVLLDDGITASSGERDATDPIDPKQWLIVENSQIESAKDKIRQFFPGVLRLTAQDVGKLQYALTKSTKLRIEEQSVSKSIEVIRNRIDEFGVTEPEIVSQGRDRIVVQLPGVKDIERAKELIGKTAKLEFKLVNEETPIATVTELINKAETEGGITFKKGDRFSEYIKKLNEYVKKDLPAGYVLAFEKKVNKLTNEIEQKIPYLVDENPRLTGEALQDARVQIDPRKNEPYVSLDFKTAGAKAFEKVTGENIGKRLAIILDGNVYSAPNIQAKIGGGRAQITLGGGGFDKIMKEARDLALVLRAGALPVQLDFLEQRTVGPSLGQDSIEKAEVAALVGAALVFFFILVYYKVSGAIAIVTLILNVLFVLACLVGFEATLTLPGIAGIALTVGMAIDANIIIYERIREEIRKGISNYKAVEGGFEQAFWTIIDANITTALAGLCLLNFGTGPIKGFAVTLLIGIVATVYTAYFVGKMLFEFYMNKVEGQDLSI